jgi:Ser/Thr protein kinase RdoA (MazF antagonist)
MVQAVAARERCNPASARRSGRAAGRARQAAKMAMRGGLPPWLARSVVTDAALRSCLDAHWGLTGVQVTPCGGGMNSETWIVADGPRRRVAKAVTADGGSQLAAGLAIAGWVEGAGIPAGAPVPARDGRLAVSAGDAWLALLTWVPGRPLTGRDDAGQDLIGRTLARVHRALAGRESPGAQRFHWVDPGAGYLGLRPWLRPAITAALRALDAARPDHMTRGLLHADPAPDAFRLDPVTGRCGVIDWSAAIHGPLLYDLASAVMHAGGPGAARTLIAAYQDAGVLSPAEIRQGLAPLLRFRWAVQANYFAWRIAGNNLTGISGPQDNEKGLEDARRALTSR